MPQFSVPSPIGGMHISAYGGAFAFVPFQGQLPPAGAPPPTNNQSILDVMRGDIWRISAVDDTTDSGSWGAFGADVAAVGFRAKATVKWDLRNPPNFLAAVGANAIEFDTNYGYQFWFYVGSGADYPSDTPPYYYFAPSAKGNLIQTIMDANAKKKVTADIEIIGNSPLFAMPPEQALYNGYIAHCLTRNWVW